MGWPAEKGRYDIKLRKGVMYVKKDSLLIQVNAGCVLAI